MRPATQKCLTPEGAKVPGTCVRESYEKLAKGLRVAYGFCAPRRRYGFATLTISRTYTT
jgi:hypothetical protein